MTPIAGARVLVVLGWLAGMALVLDGSLTLALAVVIISAAVAAGVVVRGRHALAWLKAHRPRREEKAGSALDRA